MWWFALLFFNCLGELQFCEKKVYIYKSNFNFTYSELFIIVAFTFVFIKSSHNHHFRVTISSVNFSLLKNQSKSRSKIIKSKTMRLVLATLLILLANDIESNPGPMGPDGDAPEPPPKKAKLMINDPVCVSESLHNKFEIDQADHFKKVRLLTKLQREHLLSLGIRSDSIDRSSSRKICSACISKIDQIPTHCENCKSKVIMDPNNMQNFVKSLSSEMRQELTYYIGLAERQSLQKFANDISSDRSLDTLEKWSPDIILEHENCIKSFLQGLTGGKSLSDKINNQVFTKKYINENTISKSKYQLAKVIELVLSLTVHNAVMPGHFQENLLMYYYSRSRQAVNMFSASTPAGSYSTVKKWLDDIPDNLQSFKEIKGHFAIWIDNNQTMHRRNTISENNTVKSNVITMVCFFELNRHEEFFMKQLKFKPVEWMWKDAKLNIQPISQHGDHSLEFIKREFTDKFLKLVLEDVVGEIKKSESGELYDAIDKSLDTTSELPTLSTHRNQETVYSFEKMEDNVYRLKAETVRVSRQSEYDSLSDDLLFENPTKIHVGEPVFVNPCSYASLVKVYRDLYRQAEIGTKLAWVLLVQDGLPGSLGIEIIENYMVCQSCCESDVIGKAGMEKHIKEKHAGEKVTFKQEFDWLLLSIGSGHFEMNMVKSATKLNWDVYGEKFVELYRFLSIPAKQSAKNCSCHHKSWTLKLIERWAIAKELVRCYVIHGINKNVFAFHVPGFREFAKQQTAPNFIHLYNTLQHVLEPIFAFRAGLRTGRSDLSMAAQSAYAKMFHARNHPVYRLIECYDMISQFCMPAELKDLNMYKSVNTSGVRYTGEGLDFKGEVVNQKVQRLLPGIPKNKDWSNAIKNIDRLSKLKKNVNSHIGMVPELDIDHRPVTDISKQVRTFRTLLRKTEYLDLKSKNLTSLCGKNLDIGLLDFPKKAQENKSLYYSYFIEHKSAKKFPVPSPVFVTKEEKEEYQKLSNQTNDYIRSVIQGKIEQICDDDMRLAFSRDLKNRKVKKELVDLHDIIEEYMGLYVEEVLLPDHFEAVNAI